jgi:hypothetical protein
VVAFGNTRITAGETVTVTANAFISEGDTDTPLLSRVVIFTITGPAIVASTSTTDHHNSSIASQTLTATTGAEDGTVQFALTATGAGTIEVASQIRTGAATTQGITAAATVNGAVQPQVILAASPSLLPVSY